jgi:hypothetical protein
MMFRKEKSCTTLKDGPRGHNGYVRDMLQFSASLHRCIALLKKGDFRYTVVHMLA